MKGAEMAIPHLFMCPISLDLFTDPVTLCTGQTYDRSSIEKWLSAGNQTCPVTMQKLNDTSMVPNHTLRHLIDQWLQNTHPDYYQIFTSDPSIAALKHTLESHELSSQTELETLGRLLLLADELPAQNSCLIRLGFFQLLLELVFRENQTQTFFQEKLKLVEGALVCALKLMPFCSLRPLNMLRDETKLEQFLSLFNHGTITIKKNLCQFVEAISLSPETKELCCILGSNHTLLQGLVLLVQENSGASDYGIKSISALCSLESNRGNLVREGVVGGLISYILSSERRDSNSAPKAMSILELLLGLQSGKQALIDHSSGVKAVVKMVFRVSDHEGSESAINSLMIVCSDSIEVRERAIFAGVLTQLLLLLQSQCGGRIKTKARMLLKLLRSMWNQDLIHV